MDSKSKVPVITMPSISQLLSLLDPMHVLALEGAIERHSKEYQTMVKLRAHTNAPTQFIAFAIPLDSYLPLPHAYGSTVHVPHEQSASITIVQQAPLEVQLGNKKVKAVLSVLVVGLASAETARPLKDFDEKTLLRLYREAIRLANHTLLAYKLTPPRHNHDLHPVTVTDRPSFVEVIRFDTTVGQILECGNVLMHQNLHRSMDDARLMNDREHKRLIRTYQMLGSQSDDPAAGILTTIYQATDQLCLGNYTQALVLADTYTEHLMRYALLQIRLCSSISLEGAKKELDKLRNMDALLTSLATRLQRTPTQLKDAIGFSKWQQVCRYTRNQITHQFIKTVLEARQSRAAVRETIQMTSALVDIATKKFPQTQPHLELFKMPRWYLSELEDSNNSDDQALSKVGEIHKHTYG